MSMEVRHEFTSEGNVCLSVVDPNTHTGHRLSLEPMYDRYYVTYYKFEDDIATNFRRGNSLIDDIKNRIRQHRIFEESVMSDRDPDYEYPEFEDKSMKELFLSKAYVSDFKHHIKKAVEVAVISAYTTATVHGLSFSELGTTQISADGFSERYVSSNEIIERELLVFIGRIIAYFEATYLGSTIRPGSLISNHCGFYDIKDHIFYTPEARRFANAAKHIHFDGVYGLIGYKTIPDDIESLQSMSYDDREKWAVKIMKAMYYPGVVDYTNIIDYHVPEKQDKGGYSDGNS